jgi:diguanylate cyclase (GGDEF)-like protein/PAS domain S-box-containing protein
MVVDGARTWCDAPMAAGTAHVERVELLQQLIDHLPAMVAYWDRDRRNVVANAAYLEWFGFRPEEMHGIHIRHVLGEEVYAKNLPHLDAVLRGEEQLFDRTLVDTAGRVRHTQASYVPNVVDGEVAGFFVLVTEVTARVEAERAVARAASQYRALARSLPGAFVLLFDDELRYLVADGQGLAAFGLDSAAMEGRTMPEVLPDRARDLEACYRRALQGEMSAWDRTAGGRVFHMTAGPVRSESGAVTAGMVIGVDVTGERRLAVTQAALHRLARASASRTPAVEVIEDLGETLLDLFGAGYVGIARFDGDTITIVSTSPPLPEGIGPTIPHDRRSATSRVLATGSAQVVDVGGDEPGPIGQMHAVGVRTAAAVPIHVDGRLWGALAVGLPASLSGFTDGTGVLSDFADLVALAVSNSSAWAELERRSAIDPLTGLPNRRTFDERLSEAVDRAARTGDPVAVAILDLDRFKDINDRHGHAVGDQVLAAAAAALAGACRSHEVAARLGGEEFAIVMPGAPQEAARSATERLRAAIGGGAYPPGITVTASAGCASTGGRAIDRADLTRRADAALYRAKRAGRDRTVGDDEDG